MRGSVSRPLIFVAVPGEQPVHRTTPDLRNTGGGIPSRSGAERSQIRGCVRSSDEGHRSRIMLPVERSRRQDRRAARLGFSHAVEPEADMECVHRSQGDVRVKAKYLVQEDRIDDDCASPRGVGFDIGLIPCQSEVCKVRDRPTCSRLIAALNSEQIETEIGLKVLQGQFEGIPKTAPCDGRLNRRSLAWGARQLRKAVFGNNENVF